MKRRSQEPPPDTSERIYDLPCEPLPQPRDAINNQASSIFIQLGEADAQRQEVEQHSTERRARMRTVMEDDARKSWPLEHIEVLKRGVVVCKGDKRASLVEAVERAKEQRRSLQVFPQDGRNNPIPNIKGSCGRHQGHDKKDDDVEDNDDDDDSEYSLIISSTSTSSESSE